MTTSRWSPVHVSESSDSECSTHNEGVAAVLRICREHADLLNDSSPPASPPLLGSSSPVRPQHRRKAVIVSSSSSCEDDSPQPQERRALEPRLNLDNLLPADRGVAPNTLHQTVASRIIADHRLWKQRREETLAALFSSDSDSSDNIASNERACVSPTTPIYSSCKVAGPADSYTEVFVAASGRRADSHIERRGRQPAGQSNSDTSDHAVVCSSDDMSTRRYPSVHHSKPNSQETSKPQISGNNLLANICSNSTNTETSESDSDDESGNKIVSRGNRHLSTLKTRGTHPGVVTNSEDTRVFGDTRCCLSANRKRRRVAAPRTRIFGSGSTDNDANSSDNDVDSLIQTDCEHQQLGAVANSVREPHSVIGTSRQTLISGSKHERKALVESSTPTYDSKITVNQTRNSDLPRPSSHGRRVTPRRNQRRRSSRVFISDDDTDDDFTESRHSKHPYAAGSDDDGWQYSDTCSQQQKARLEQLYEAEQLPLRRSEPLRDAFALTLQYFASCVLEPECVQAFLEDDYFGRPFRRVTAVLADRKVYCVSSASWPRVVQEKLDTHPHLSSASAGHGRCDACNKRSHDAMEEIALHGRPYIRGTFNTVRASLSGENEAVLLLGKSCARRVKVYHRLEHYLLRTYRKCAQKIKSLQLRFGRDPPEIIRHLLDETHWIERMYADFQKLLTDADSFRRR